MSEKQSLGCVLHGLAATEHGQERPTSPLAQDLIDNAPRGTGLLVPGRNEGIKAADPPAAYSQDLRSLKRRLRDESWSALVARNPHSICTKLER